MSSVPSWQRPGRRRAAGLLVPAAIALPLLLTAAAGWLSWRQATLESRSELARSAAGGAEYALRVLESHRLAAELVNFRLRGVADADIRADELAYHAQLCELLPTLPMVQTVAVSDHEGWILLTANVAPVPRVSVADREWVQALRVADAPPLHLSAVTIGRVDRNLFFGISVRRRDTGNLRPEGGFDGVVNVAINPDSVSSGLDRLRGHKDDRSALVRTDGALLARVPPRPDPPPWHAQEPRLLSAMASGAPSGVVANTSSVDGSPVLTAFHRIEGWPAYVVISRVPGAVAERWLALAWPILAVGLLATLALALLAGIAARAHRRLAEANAGLEQRVAERTGALAEGEARLRLALSTAALGIVEWDLEAGTFRVDPGVEAISRGLLPAGRTLSMEGPERAAWVAAIDAPARADRAAQLAALQAGTASVLRGDYRVRVPDAAGGTQEIWITFRGGAVARDPVTGRITRVIDVIQEITDRKRAEDVLSRDRQMLERLVEDRTAALLRAADDRRRAEDSARQNEKLAALGQLTGGIAHDFNNILQVVASGAALLRRPNLSEDRRALVVEGLEQAAGSARDLTGRLLAFARRQALAPEVFDLNARLAKLAGLLDQTLGPVELRLELASDLWPVRADPGQFEAAALNLVANARDAMPHGGRLTLATRNARLPASEGRAAGDYVELLVSDTGEGMPASVLARAFEPFFTTKEGGRGTGLGLPQVFGFARQSDGDVEIASRPGQGTDVRLHLPRSPVPAKSAAAGPSPRPVAAAAAQRPGDGSGSDEGRRTVLVVDDNADARNFAASLLEEQGYATLSAGTVAEAMALIAGGAMIDAVFSDVVMPGGADGMQLAADLAVSHPGMAVVLATGYSASMTDRRRPEGVPPAVEVLSKPYRLDELAAALERALGAAGRRLDAHRAAAPAPGD